MHRKVLFNQLHLSLSLSLSHSFFLIYSMHIFLPRRRRAQCNNYSASILSLNRYVGTSGSGGVASMATASTVNVSEQWPALQDRGRCNCSKYVRPDLTCQPTNDFLTKRTKIVLFTTRCHRGIRGNIPGAVCDLVAS